MSPAGHDEHRRPAPHRGSGGASTTRDDLGHCVARVREVRFLTFESDDHFSLAALEGEIFDVYAVTNDEGETSLQIRPTWSGRSMSEKAEQRTATSDREQSHESDGAVGRSGD